MKRVTSFIFKITMVFPGLGVLASVAIPTLIKPILKLIGGRKTRRRRKVGGSSVLSGNTIKRAIHSQRGGSIYTPKLQFPDMTRRALGNYRFPLYPYKKGRKRRCLKPRRLRA